MKPAPFAYRRPATLPEAVTLLAGEPGAKVLAGGQSLVPLLSMRLASPALLVDINGLPGLDHVRAAPDGVRVGALARHTQVLDSAAVREAQPLLGMALAEVAHATIRNRGTTVGSLVHADPAAEMPVVLLLLGGTLTVEGPAGRRTIAADDLFAGPLETSVGRDEVAVEAFFPVLPADTGVAFDEIARRRGDYALCGVAALVQVQGDRVVRARAGYLSVGDLPVVVDLTAALDGSVSDASLAEAGRAALARLDPATDIHASAAYRAQLVRVLTARVLRAAYSHARSRASERGPRDG